MGAQTTNSAPLARWLLFCLLTVTLFPWVRQALAQETPGGPPLKLALAVAPAACSGLIAVADEAGFFKAAGLEVSMDPHPSGRKALEALYRGDARAATVTDVAFAVEILNEPSIRVLASIGTTLGSQIVARKDRNIHNLKDLRGKRVGYSADTISEYCLIATLIIEEISQDDITLVDIPAARQVDALLEGDVDAVSAFDTNAFEAKKRLGQNAVYWDSQNNLAFHWLLVAHESLIQSPEPYQRLLEALIKAESFAQTNQDEAIRIISQKWGFDPAYVEQAWPRNRLSVSFGQSIVTSLRTYALWQTEKSGDPVVPPDVLDYLHPDVLDAVDPRRVTIFR